MITFYDLGTDVFEENILRQRECKAYNILWNWRKKLLPTLHYAGYAPAKTKLSNPIKVPRAYADSTVAVAAVLLVFDGTSRSCVRQHDFRDSVSASSHKSPSVTNFLVRNLT
ncbi:hypothetical protein ACJJTC_006800 [Scirpophaga incertulas]